MIELNRQHNTLTEGGLHNVINELYSQFQKFDIDYYNDLNCLGLGVINPKKFNFQIIIDTINGIKFDIENIEKQEYLIPIFWKPDYGIFYMPVINISNKYYEVQVNKENRVFVDTLNPQTKTPKKSKALRKKYLQRFAV